MSQNFQALIHTLPQPEYFNHFYESLNSSRNPQTRSNSVSTQVTLSSNQFLQNLEQFNDIITPRGGVSHHTPSKSVIPSIDLSYQSPTKSPTRYPNAMRNNTTTPTNKFSSPYSLEPTSPTPLLTHVPLLNSYPLEPFSSFLYRMGMNHHPEAETLRKLGNIYDQARFLPEKDETIFNAICFCLFERLLNMDNQALFGSQLRALFGTEEWVRSHIFLFTTLLKGLGQEPNPSKRIAKFYEAITRDMNLYQRGVAASKEVIEKLLKQIEYGGEKFKLTIFWKWMNEIDNLTRDLFEKIAQTLQVNIKFIILSSTTLKEETFSYSQVSSSFHIPTQQNNEFVIFYNRIKEQAFLLSTSTELTKIPLEEAGLLSNNNSTNFPHLPIESPIHNSGLLNEATRAGSKTPQNYHHHYKVLPIIKEDEVEMRYGTLQPTKPKVNNENQLIEQRPVYSTPILIPMNLDTMQQNRHIARNPSIHLKIQTEGIGNGNNNDHSPLGSNWLSRDSFSDLPSTPGGLDNSEWLNNHFPEDQMEKAKRHITSPMHSISLVRSTSEPQNRSFTSFTPKPKATIQGNLLDAFDGHYMKLLQVQTPNRIAPKRPDFEYYQSSHREKMQRDKSPLKRDFISVEEAPTKLPDGFSRKLFHFNQNLTMHGPEFDSVTTNRYQLINRDERNQAKIWNLDSLKNKYHEILGKKKKESTPVFQPLAAMKMDE